MLSQDSCAALPCSAALGYAALCFNILMCLCLGSP